MSDIPPPFDALWFRLLIGFLIGGALGSFITMLSYRLPRRLSIVMPPSHCPHCKRPLRARDLVPVLSWSSSGGRCRYCKAPISLRYPLIELAAALLSALAFVWFGFQPTALAALVMITAVMTVVTIKIERKN